MKQDAAAVPHATYRHSMRGGTQTLRANIIDGGALYDADELEALKAMDRYKREHKRPFPHLTDLLDVLRELGWRKQ